MKPWTLPQWQNKVSEEQSQHPQGSQVPTKCQSFTVSNWNFQYQFFALTKFKKKRLLREPEVSEDHNNTNIYTTNL